MPEEVGGKLTLSVRPSCAGSSPSRPTAPPFAPRRKKSNVAHAFAA